MGYLYKALFRSLKAARAPGVHVTGSNLSPFNISVRGAAKVANWDMNHRLIER